MPGPLVIYVGSDDQVVEQTLIDFLSDLGNQAAGFDSNADLTSKLASSPADVVITSLDYVSQDGADGIQFLQQIHQKFPKVAVILITNGGPDISASEAASCGVRYFLREPIRLSELELVRDCRLVYK